MTAIRMLVVMSVLTGLLYTLVVTVIGNAMFPHQAQGSIVLRDNVVIGSELLAQRFSERGYFWPRPSVTDFQTLPSGASNMGPTSEGLRQHVLARRQALAAAHTTEDLKVLPVDLIYASGSGLDPHITLQAAYFQTRRVAKYRLINPSDVATIVATVADGAQCWLWGEPRVNVLRLNLAIDAWETGRKKGLDGVSSTHDTN